MGPFTQFAGLPQHISDFLILTFGDAAAYLKVSVAVCDHSNTRFKVVKSFYILFFPTFAGDELSAKRKGLMDVPDVSMNVT